MTDVTPTPAMTPDAQPKRHDPGSSDWEAARALLVATMRRINQSSPDNGYLARDADQLERGELGHVDAWIALTALAERPVEAGVREALEGAFDDGFAFAEGKWHEGTPWNDHAMDRRRRDVDGRLATLAAAPPPPTAEAMRETERLTPTMVHADDDGTIYVAYDAPNNDIQPFILDRDHAVDLRDKLTAALAGSSS